jgi:hypothetical protein
MHELPTGRVAVGLKRLREAERPPPSALVGRPPSAAGPRIQPPPQRPNSNGAERMRPVPPPLRMARRRPSARAACPGFRPGATPLLAHAWRAGAILVFTQCAWIWAVSRVPTAPGCRVAGAGHRLLMTRTRAALGPPRPRRLPRSWRGARTAGPDRQPARLARSGSSATTGRQHQQSIRIGRRAAGATPLAATGAGPRHRLGRYQRGSRQDSPVPSSGRGYGSGTAPCPAVHGESHHPHRLAGLTH